ncbi:MAG: hypothetical protein Q8J78_14540 [Moraxellaceae bacterium]|nr:hypothetical protein [Moraxellaceae bacterium]
MATGARYGLPALRSDFSWQDGAKRLPLCLSGRPALAGPDPGAPPQSRADTDADAPDTGTE